MKSAGHRTKELKVIPVSVSDTVNANDTTKTINVPTPAGITTILGAPNNALNEIGGGRIV